eukprot:scaffold8777_cov297-Ochromonas_danica.AAC.2
MTRTAWVWRGLLVAGYTVDLIGIALLSYQPLTMFKVYLPLLSSLAVAVLDVLEMVTRLLHRQGSWLELLRLVVIFIDIFVVAVLVTLRSAILREETTADTKPSISGSLGHDVEAVTETSDREEKKDESKACATIVNPILCVEGNKRGISPNACATAPLPPLSSSPTSSAHQSAVPIPIPPSNSSGASAKMPLRYSSSSVLSSSSTKSSHSFGSVQFATSLS